jgi:hypothetical protein
LAVAVRIYGINKYDDDDDDDERWQEIGEIA